MDNFPQNELFTKVKDGHIEGRPESLPLSKIEKITEQMKNSICIIDKINSTGTGFICLMPFPDKLHPLPVLITANHVLGVNDLKPEKKIILKFNQNEIILNLDVQRKAYTNPNYDVTIIELKNDEYKIESLLEIDNDVFKNCELVNIYKEKPVYILHYPRGKEVSYSLDLIKSVEPNNSKMILSCPSEEGSAGAPILNLDTYKIIGIHLGKNDQYNYNCGTIIRFPINDFYNLYHQKLTNKNKPIINENNTTPTNIISEINYTNPEPLIKKKLDQINTRNKQIHNTSNPISNYQFNSNINNQFNPIMNHSMTQFRNNQINPILSQRLKSPKSVNNHLLNKNMNNNINQIHQEMNNNLNNLRNSMNKQLNQFNHNVHFPLNDINNNQISEDLNNIYNEMMGEPMNKNVNFKTNEVSNTQRIKKIARPNPNIKTRNIQISQSPNAKIRNTYINPNPNLNIRNTQVNPNANINMRNTHINPNININMRNAHINPNPILNIRNTQINPNQNLDNIYNEMMGSPMNFNNQFNQMKNNNLNNTMNPTHNVGLKLNDMNNQEELKSIFNEMMGDQITI